LDRLNGTHQFCWHDAPSKAGIVDGHGADALTTHPPALEGLNWGLVARRQRQLENLAAAEIDIVLPVF
jgi:hypothetical protein